MSACTLPSGCENVTSKRLFAFRESNARDGCRVSRAQAVRDLSPRCLPCIRPMSDRLALVAHVVRSDCSSSTGTAITNVRSWLLGVVPGSVLRGSMLKVLRFGFGDRVSFQGE